MTFEELLPYQNQSIRVSYEDDRTVSGVLTIEYDESWNRYWALNGVPVTVDRIAYGSTELT
jgi:hypothetical protein